MAEGVLVDLYLLCSFGFDFIVATLGQSKSPFLIIQCRQPALPPIVRTYVPEEGARQQESLVMGSYKGLLLSGRWYQMV